MADTCNVRLMGANPEWGALTATAFLAEYLNLQVQHAHKSKGVEDNYRSISFMHDEHSTHAHVLPKSWWNGLCHWWQQCCNRDSHWKWAASTRHVNDTHTSAFSYWGALIIVPTTCWVMPWPLNTLHASVMMHNVFSSLTWSGHH